MAHFEAALRQIHTSCDADTLKFYEEFQKHGLREKVGRRREEPVQAIYR